MNFFVTEIELDLLVSDCCFDLSFMPVASLLGN